MKVLSLYWPALICLFLLQKKVVAQTTAKEEVIALNYKLVNGFLDEEATIMGTFFKWEEQTPYVTGIPANLKDVKIATVIFDEPQYYYQMFLAKKIDSATYKQKAERYKASSQWLINEQIKCFGYILSGVNENGSIIIICDSNNNKDFSDDTLFNATETPDLQHKGYTKNFNIQFAGSNGISNESIPLHISYNGAKSTISQLSYNFPVHAVASFERDGNKYDLKFCSQYSMALHFLGAQFYVTRADKGDQAVEQVKFIRIGNEVYENKGIDIHARILNLKKVDETNLVSPTVGFNAPSFSVKEINTKADINLDKYNGKYLLIDFWATWCPPCIASMTTLKENQKWLTANNVSLLGVNIAVKEDLAKVKKMIADKGYIWEQVFSDELTQLFKVGAIPSNFLIGPDGKIVAKDLDIANLKNGIKPFIK